MNIEEYKDVFVFAEQRDGKIQNVAMELLGKAHELAQSLGEKVVAVLCGNNIADKAQSLIAAGADKVVVVEDPVLETYMTEPYAQAITKVIQDLKPSIFMLGATTIGRDLGPRLSARNVTGLTADCTKLEIGEERTFLMTRPAFGGNLMATITCKNHRPQMATVRPGVMQRMAADNSRKGEVVSMKVDFNMEKINRVKLIENVKEAKTSPTSPKPRFLSPVAVASALAKDSPNSKPWPKSSAAKCRRPVPWSTLASCPRAVRWDRPARPSVLPSTWLAASAAPSSTWPVWRRASSSSPSTKTSSLQSSAWLTSAS